MNEEETGWHRWVHHHGKGRSKWLYAAWHCIGRGDNQHTEGHVEWCLLKGYRDWNKTLGVKFGRNGSESDVGLDIHIPWLGSIYARLRAPWTARFRIDPDSGDPNWHYARHYSLKLNYGGRLISGGWGELDGMWSKGQPWYRDFGLSSRHIWGRIKADKVIDDTGETVIPMPEGLYPATWELDHYERRHVRWPGTMLDWFAQPDTPTYSLKIPGGIPHWGKGENSWDCGMDGLFGISGGFNTIEKAVGAAVEASLRDRRKYGGPHDLPRPMSVSEAEDHIRTRSEQKATS